jgi:uncharacterized protein (DUF1810 family)
LLGTRLVECAQTLLAHGDQSIREIIGSPDDLKLRSSMTLFLAAQPDGPEASVFGRVLASFFEGHQDDTTLRLIAERDNGAELT